MSTSITRTALAVGVAGSLLAAPPALARGPVFGGATTNSQAIVLRTDAKAKKLTSAVVAWEATCTDGLGWTDSADLTVVAAEPGFAPGLRELAVSRNGRGKFAGTQLFSSSAADMRAAAVMKISGRMTAKRASGTLTAHVTVVDGSGQQQATCDTGTVHWSATRAPGRVFGGVTSQAEPVVVRLDRSGRKVSDLMIGWGSTSCVPDAYFNFGEFFSDFAVKSRRFGDSFTQSYDMDDGSKRTFAYDVAGKVSRKDAHGSLRVTLKQTDPAGAEALSCDTGAISWRALTG